MRKRWVTTSSSFFLFPVAKAIVLGVLDAISLVALIGEQLFFRCEETQNRARQTNLPIFEPQQRFTIGDDTSLGRHMHN